MNKLKKYEMPILISISLLVLVALVSVSYAYFKAKISNIESASTIAFTSGEMTINYENNSATLTGTNIIPGWSTTKTFTLKGKNDSKATDTKPDNNMYYKIGIAVDKNTFTSGALKYLLTKDSSSSTNGKMQDATEGIIPQSGTKYIGKGYFTTTSSYVNHIYKLTVSFPETGVNQAKDNGKIFAAHVVIDKSLSTETIETPSVSSAVDYIANLYATTLSGEGLEMDTTDDKNIRYVGANPKNYVEFGNTGELWRIIGVFNSTDSIGTTTKKLKIVRNESIGEFGYNNINSNIWKDVDLNRELNDDYLNYSLTSNPIWYGGLNDTNIEFNKDYTIKSNYHQLIENTNWNVGFASSFPDSAYNIYNSEKTELLTNKVGLISASDYAYALGSRSTCVSDVTSADCRFNNWIFNVLSQGNNAFILTAYFDSILMLYTDHGLIYINQSPTTATANVYPCVYLKNNTIILSGTGTKSNPYKLSI